MNQNTLRTRSSHLETSAMNLRDQWQYRNRLFLELAGRNNNVIMGQWSDSSKRIAAVISRVIRSGCQNFAKANLKSHQLEPDMLNRSALFTISAGVPFIVKVGVKLDQRFDGHAVDVIWSGSKLYNRATTDHLGAK
jgi:hypothetical protein